VTHGSQVVDLRGLDVIDDGDEIGGVAQVTVVQEDLDSGLVAVLVDVLNSASIEGTGATYDAVDLQQENAVSSSDSQLDDSIRRRHF